MQTPGNQFLETAIRRLKYYKDLGDKTLNRLNDDQVHFQYNEECNSIAVIVQHVAGNMLSRWTNFLTEDGEKEWRQRDEEFTTHSLSQQQVIHIWEKGWNCFITALESLTEDHLLQTVTIRQEPLLVIDAINRQLAHYPYHIGQIIHIAKEITGSSWESLSIPRGNSAQYNSGSGIKDPSKKFSGTSQRS